MPRSPSASKNGWLAIRELLIGLSVDPMNSGVTNRQERQCAGMPDLVGHVL
jgi:hypothetical protein